MVFCTDSEFCNYFSSLEGKIEFDNVGLNIDFKKNDDEIINLLIRTTESFDVLCDEYECVTSFEASFYLLVKDGPINMIICMNFDDTKSPEGLEGKEFLFDIISVDISPYQDWDYNISFFITRCNASIN